MVRAHLSAISLVLIIGALPVLSDERSGITSTFSDVARIVDSDLTFHVTSLDDAGPGTFRQAIADSASAGCRATFPCRIDFGVSGMIEPVDPLPAIESSGIVIDASDEAVILDGSRQEGGAGLRLMPLADPHGTAFTLLRGLTIQAFDGDGIVVSPEVESAQATRASTAA